MELMLVPNPQGVANTDNHSQNDTASGCGCGSMFSFGTAGCNLACKFCQNGVSPSRVTR
jgi:pyruvate-formate lyase-activating enzyme